jgi:virginiamycin A acetyltransferase
VISAQSFVVRNVPPYAVVAGNPAEVLFYRFREKQIKTLLQLRWWDWPLERILRSIHLLNGASIEDFILDAQTME